MRRLLSVLVSLGFVLTVLHGQTVRLGAEFQVNTYTTNYQERPEVSRNDAGTFVVVWQSFGQDGSGWGIFGQRYDSTGNPLGGEFQVNTYTTGDQAYPDVAIDNSGNFVVVWQSTGQAGTVQVAGTDIYAQRFSSTGAPSGGEFFINTYTTNDQLAPNVDSDGSGNFVVVWESLGQDNGYFGCFGQRYNSVGVAQGSTFRANSYTRDDQGYPVVAKDNAGNFVVAWQSYGQEGNYTDYGIYAQRYKTTGVTNGNEFHVNTYTTGEQSGSAVAMSGAGSFVVMWESYHQDGSLSSIIGQRYNSAGTKQGTEIQVNTYTYEDQRSPSVVMDATGNFVAVWRSRLQDGFFSGIYGQRFTSAGAKRGLEFQVNTYTPGDQRMPSVGADSAGNFVVVWSSPGEDGSSSGVFAQRFSASDCTALALSGPAGQTICSSGSAAFTVTPTGTGPFTYQWRKGTTNLVDGPLIRGTQGPTLRIMQAAAGDAGSYNCVVSDFCLPTATMTSASATLTVGAGTAAGHVSNLLLTKLNAGASLKLNWTNTTNATDYVVFRDSFPDGAFAATLGTATSGTTGLTVAMPAGNAFVLVAGRNGTCGVGPLP